jgi:hypothetical protein
MPKSGTTSVASALTRVRAICLAFPGSGFVPPYVGKSGWVGVRLDRKKSAGDWDAVRAIAEDGWRMGAPKRLLTANTVDPLPQKSRPKRPVR